MHRMLTLSRDWAYGIIAMIIGMAVGAFWVCMTEDIYEWKCIWMEDSADCPEKIAREISSQGGVYCCDIALIRSELTFFVQALVSGLGALLSLSTFSSNNDMAKRRRNDGCHHVQIGGSAWPLV
eukprot:TRINITY_DN4181_c0_g1_i1.p1 TRINITY_DN4181_c0_g1~~TRINITY_DN4181_c0_g1_i1.p1  ORF type:complete len:124 (+),score=11.83 TRINITY_DN4181_c0_g1_i1:152-523(+)